MAMDDTRDAPAGDFVGGDYLTALETHYPDIARGDTDGSRWSDLGIRFAGDLHARQHELTAAWPERFVRLEHRPVASVADAWTLSKLSSDLRTLSARASYKGLLHIKPPFDLVLYANLIWELQPRTILEFGAGQGGSSLWFADQLEAQVGAGAVHSFELLTHGIHPRAAHPRLTFHHADLRNVASLDRALLSALPHPWLVVDDAHTNLPALVPFVLGFMQPGDYYVLEDVYAQLGIEHLALMVALANAYQLRVDSKYADGFGLNVTASANSWFRVMEPGR
jgi:cephalosporin hydroxylase